MALAFSQASEEEEHLSAAPKMKEPPLPLLMPLIPLIQ